MRELTIDKFIAPLNEVTSLVDVVARAGIVAPDKNVCVTIIIEIRKNC